MDKLDYWQWDKTDSVLWEVSPEGARLILRTDDRHIQSDDARRIEALPRLLAACEAVYKWALADGYGEDYPLVAQMADALRAAGVELIEKYTTVGEPSVTVRILAEVE